MQRWAVKRLVAALPTWSLTVSELLGVMMVLSASGSCSSWPLRVLSSTGPPVRAAGSRKEGHTHRTGSHRQQQSHHNPLPC